MTDTVPPSFLEDAISKQPAMELLQKLGWKYLRPEEAVRLRGGRRSAVLLDGVLEEQLRKLNRVRYKGEEYAFSEGNIQTALMALRDIGFDGVLRPDHVPTVEGDSNANAGYSSFGRLYAIGYIRGLREAVYAE